MYLLIVDKGQACELIKGPYRTAEEAIAVGRRIAAADSEQGYTVRCSWDVYEMHHLDGGSDR
jgi:hypothetical protein